MNEVVDFIQKLLQSKHGSLDKARYSVSKNEVNARCPYCLDSRTNTRKRRWYYSLENNVWMCHNCDRTGNLAKLLNDFRNIPTINYDKLFKEIGWQKVKDFIDGEHKIQDQKVAEQEWTLEYPDGARLDVLINDKTYKKLPQEDKQALAKVIRYLGLRGVKKEWFRYFYFIFPGEDHDQYILTLFEYNGSWIWSGRKVDDNRPGPKYLNFSNFPFHLALGFANEVSTTKGTDLYVVESFWSALLLNQVHLNSVCIFGLANMKENHPALDIFRKKYDLIWCPDNDGSFKQFCEINKNLQRKMKILITPEKDVADYAVKKGDKFRKNFLSLPVRNLYDQMVLNDLKTII